MNMGTVGAFNAIMPINGSNTPMAANSRKGIATAI
jgi:hypothetical protein